MTLISDEKTSKQLKITAPNGGDSSLPMETIYFIFARIPRA